LERFTEQVTTFVVMVLFLSILVGNAKSYGAFDGVVVGNPSYNYSISNNQSNITFIGDTEQLKPPVCTNLGQIPIVSDFGCMVLTLLWVNGITQMSSDFTWFNYIWIVPLSIGGAILVARMVRGN
jgi:hypothetical protein